MKNKYLLNTGTSVIQAFYEKKGSTLKDEYRQSTAIAYMDTEDMKKEGLKSHDRILIKSEWGKVVVYVDKSHDSPHRNMIFMPKGPWSNILISPETYCSNIPTYKAIEVTLTKTTQEVLLASDLIRQTYNKYGDQTIHHNQKPIYIQRGQ